MALAARAMGTMAQQVGGEAEQLYADVYLQAAAQLEELSLLRELHYDNASSTFADFGLDTAEVRLSRRAQKRTTSGMQLSHLCACCSSQGVTGEEASRARACAECAWHPHGAVCGACWLRISIPSAGKALALRQQRVGEHAAADGRPCAALDTVWAAVARTNLLHLYGKQPTCNSC